MTEQARAKEGSARRSHTNGRFDALGHRDASGHGRDTEEPDEGFDRTIACA